mgnify:CR=1 FL=1
MSETPPDIDKCYFYITSDDKVVVGWETSPHSFHNTIIGDLADIKNRKISFTEELYKSLDKPKEEVKKGLFDSLLLMIKNL